MHYDYKKVNSKCEKAVILLYQVTLDFRKYENLPPFMPNCRLTS